jgi:hypothetical protein
MSAPAAKALGEPVRTIAEMVGSEERREVQVFSSFIRGEKRALRALGLLRVTVLCQLCLQGSGGEEGWRTQSDTRTGSAELDVLIIVFGRGCGVWASHTRSYSLDKARGKRWLV